MKNALSVAPILFRGRERRIDRQTVFAEKLSLFPNCSMRNLMSKYYTSLR